MSPTAAMLILSHNYKQNSATPAFETSSFRVKMEGKWVWGVSRKTQSEIKPKRDGDESTELQKRFEESVQLSCWSS
ncbi:hypothetical protein ACHQM5_018085 [Ranunculus cassubicifolius]